MIIRNEIKKIIYNNDTFHIFNLKDNTRVKLTFRIDFELKAGMYIEIEGDFVNEEKYGLTFVGKKIIKKEKQASFDILSIAIDGIGEKKAQEIIEDIGDYSILKKEPFKIFDYFLSKTSLDVLKQIQEKRHLFTSNEKEVVAKQMNKEIKGIGTKKILSWMEKFEEEFPYDTYLFLTDDIIIKFLASDTALKIYEQIQHIDELENAYKKMVELKIPNYVINYLFKDFHFNVLNKIKENPYILLEYGLDFVLVDNIAIKEFNISLSNDKRIVNGIVYTIKKSEKEGNTFINFKEGISNSSKLLDIDESVIDLYITNEIRKAEPEFILKDDMLYRRVIYFTERKLGNILSLKAKSNKNVIPEFILKYIESTSLSEIQKFSVCKVLTEKISILTGGPGTGKTTTINEVCNCLDKMHKKYFLCAPTGRAAKRINESTNREAQTLHRLLEYKPRGNFGTFLRNEKYPLYADYIIVDESSMLDVYMLNSLMKALRQDTSIIFVGDIDQLPSVSMGSVLRDMKDSGVIPVYVLTEVFRQSLESNIVKNAYHIKNNEPLELGDDFKFVKVSNYDEVKLELEKLNFEYQILCPMRIGNIGTIKINQLMQGLSNKNTKYAYGNGQIYKVNDKIIQMDNNYNKEVYNGEIGTILSIDEEFVTIKYPYNTPEIIKYKLSELYEIDLSYAISIHKSQGSEADNVVLIIDGSEKFLSKELIYTAVTRAKKSITLLSTYDLEFYSKLETSNTRMTNLNNLIQ